MASGGGEETVCMRRWRAKKERGRMKEKRRDRTEEAGGGERRRRDKLGKEEARHGVYGVLLSENKSLLLFYHSYLTAGIVKHT